MNSRERIAAAMAFRAPDRVPVVAQVFAHAAVLAGVPVEAYIRDGGLIARCQLAALERYGYDAVFAVMDVSVETEALGSRLTYRPGHYPTVATYALKPGVVPEDLALPDPGSAGRMPELLRAAALLRAAVGDDVLVVGCVVGPMTLAVQLMGVEAALYLAADAPEEFARLLDLASAVCLRFGTAQIAAGAHLPLVFDPSASPAVIPPQFYREFVLPRHERVLAAFRQAGSTASWLHVTGPILPIMPWFANIGVDIANIDYCVDPVAARARLPRTCLDGNVKPLAFVQETPADIAAASASLLDDFAGDPGFLLSSGCEIPPESRPENIAAMVMAARREA